MSDVMAASIKEKLWHKMRQDLTTYIPQVAETNLLMCCTCGRFLPQGLFDLEHLIPQQAVKQDPHAVRANPETPINVRSGNLLLCKKPPLVKKRPIHNNGCNSWKGRHYDKLISELIFGSLLESPTPSDAHIIAALSLAYLAMVAEFGYIIVLVQSGALMREQFFSPRKFHRHLPLRHQILLRGTLPVLPPDAPLWSKPFSFNFDSSGVCTVGARNFALLLPVSRDPRLPIARHLPIVPIKYKLRPDFRTFFD
jgi:hypothetical protein